MAKRNSQGTKPTPKKPAKRPQARKAPVKGTTIPPRRKKTPVAPVIPPDDRSLNARQQRFVSEYLIDLNATQAAVRAGYSQRTARVIGQENLLKPAIAAAIERGRQSQQKRTEINADAVLREAWNIVTADARELVQIKVGCCRHCYGEAHKYQRTVSEYNADMAVYLAAQKAGTATGDFDEQGGIGFDPLKPPAADCPECGGDGEARTVLSDTRNLSAAAVSLYAGAERTKYGIKVVMHDKAAAMEKLMRHLGLFEADNRQQTDPLTALLQSLTTGTGSALVPIAVDPERDTAAPAEHPGDDAPAAGNSILPTARGYTGEDD